MTVEWALLNAPSGYGLTVPSTVVSTETVATSGNGVGVAAGAAVGTGVVSAAGVVGATTEAGAAMLTGEEQLRRGPGRPCRSAWRPGA